MRRYKVTGTQGVYDDASGTVIQPGGLLMLDPHDERTRIWAEIGVITADTKDTAADTATADCPLCVEQGKKKAPAFARQAELEAHYTSEHPGFVVPTILEGSE